jgi:hypothetical protein
MPKRSSKDINETAFAVVQQATGHLEVLHGRDSVTEFLSPSDGEELSLGTSPFA